MISVARWAGTAIGLAAIVAFYHLLFHANQTTVALTMLLLILFVAANWGLRLAVVCSLVATACYNYFFLPPIGSFTIADPQNLVAIAVFLITSVVASRMSDRIRAESRHARSRQAELEVLYSLSRGLLQTDELAQTTNAIPAAVISATGCQSVLFYLAEGERLYRAGLDWPQHTSSAELQELSQAPGVFTTQTGDRVIPLRTGVRPQGTLVLRGVHLSSQTLEALGGLISVSLDRARAVQAGTQEEIVKRSERFRSSILDAITQDLQAPLTSIKEATEALRRKPLEATATHDQLTVIEEESDRLNQIVAETTELALLETQQANMALAPQHLHDLVSKAMQAKSAELFGHEVIVRFAASLTPVVADANRLQKVLGHLLENAAQYSAAGAPIYISAELSGQKLACSIADQGIGIDAEEQAFIFDRLYRIRERKRRPSDGMSLALCRAILDAHHGSISVTSQPGRGSVFTCVLPVSRIPESTAK